MTVASPDRSSLDKTGRAWALPTMPMPTTQLLMPMPTTEGPPSATPLFLTPITSLIRGIVIDRRRQSNSSGANTNMHDQSGKVVEGKSNKIN